MKIIRCLTVLFFIFAVFGIISVSVLLSQMCLEFIGNGIYGTIIGLGCGAFVGTTFGCLLVLYFKSNKINAIVIRRD